MKRLNLLVTSIVLVSSAAAADWTLIFTHRDGTKWYSAESFDLQDGSIRTWLKWQKGKKSGEPFALLINCSKREVRNYVAGELGSEYFEPWQPLKPDSIGEMSYNSFCKMRDQPQLNGIDESKYKAAKAEGYSDEEIAAYLKGKKEKKQQ